MKRIEITKENCIATTHPEIAVQWHPTLNEGLTPFDVRAGSTDRVWWLCDKGHEWKTEVRVRCQRNNGCPCCCGRYVVKGETDLESQRPDLVKEWDFEENGDYTPDKASIHSPRKVGWVCSKGHKWIAVIEKRTQRNQGCPYCSGRRAIPGETDIATTNPELMSLWDYEKNAEEGIYPENIKSGSDVKTWWKCENGHSWQTMTKQLTRGRRCPYCSGNKVATGETDLATVRPDLAEEWHPTKNKGLKPSDIMPRYSKKVWWLGKCGHEWRANPDHRYRGSGCPICLGMKALTVENSIFEMAHDIVKDWDYDKNGDLHPKNVAWKSGKDIWWKCDNGHSYQMKPNTKITINKKTKELHIADCPYCSGQRVLAGYNDLATTHPELMKEWDFDKNTIIPSEITHGSDKKVWWKCNQNHSWEATVSSRSSMKRGCPYCTGKVILTGYNDLQTLNPELAAEWHPTKNKITADQVSLHDHHKYWWKCKEGHEWEISPHNRSYGSGCPFCSGRFAIKGETDLATLMPEIAEEWNYDKNRGKTPQMFTKYSKRKVWWKCDLGHEWRTAIVCRTGLGHGCPECAKNRR